MANNPPKKLKEEQDEGLPIWMATFADMMTLLFAFFVLLFSMSTIDPVKVSAMEDAMEQNAVKAGGATDNTKQAMLSVSEIKGTLEDIIQDLNIEDGATVSSDPRGVVLELDGSVCFQSLSSDLKHEFLKILVEIKEKVMSHPYDKRTVIIEGHTDNQPINPSAKLHNKKHIRAIEVWPTNRHLSGARASQVVEELTKDGFCLPSDDLDANLRNGRTQGSCAENQIWFEMGIKPNRLVAAGYGEFWPFGEAWVNVKDDSFGSDKCFVKDSVLAQQRALDSNTKYKYITVEKGKSGRTLIPITQNMPNYIKSSYDIDNNSIVDQDECQSNGDWGIGYWGNEIDFLNTTAEQQNKNRRVKIIFSGN